MQKRDRKPPVMPEPTIPEKIQGFAVIVAKVALKVAVSGENRTCFHQKPVTHDTSDNHVRNEIELKHGGQEK